MTQSTATSYSFLGTNRKILLLGTRFVQWTALFSASPLQWDTQDTAQDLRARLDETAYDLVLLDDQLDTNLAVLVGELKQRYASTLVAIVTDTPDLDYHVDLLDFGADDVMFSAMDTEAVAYRIHLLLRQRHKNLALARRTRDLHNISLLARELHAADQPNTLLTHVIETIGNTFGIYGVAVTVDQGDYLHLYAGSRETSGSGRLYESTAPMHDYDPLSYVITTGISQIYGDIRKHPYYQSIPTINDPVSALVIPLKYGEQVLGSLALFAQTETFNANDLAAYELLASHLANAYYNVQHYHDREVAVRSKNEMLRVWQSLSSLYQAKHIASTLGKQLSEMSNVENVGVWLFDFEHDNAEIATWSTNPKLTSVIEAMHPNGSLTDLTRNFDMGMKPLPLHQRSQRKITDLFDAMGSPQLLMVPIAGSMVGGGIFLASTGGAGFNTADVNLFESVAHAAAQAIERNTLIGTLQEQQSRMETILRSTHEAIFFVSEADVVVFCNPQFTEFTGIAPGQVIGEPSEMLLQRLSQISRDPDVSYNQLFEAREHLLSATRSDVYSVVDLQIMGTQNDIYVEFMPTISTDKQHVGWLGLIQDTKQAPISDPTHESQIMQNVIDDMGIPLFELQKTMMVLSDQNTRLSARQSTQLIAKLNQQVRDMQFLWDNFAQVYQLEMSSIDLERESIEPVELVTDLISSYRLEPLRHQIQLTQQPPNVRVEVDRQYVAQVIFNSLDFVASYASNDTIHVQVTPENDTVTISIQHRNTVLTDDMLATLFDLGDMIGETVQTQANRLGLYLSQRLIAQHGGTMTIESKRGWGLIVKISLPITNIDDTIPLGTSIQARSVIASKGLSVVVVESQNRMLANLYDVLNYQDYELYIETGFDQAIANLGLTQVDLLILEFAFQQRDPVRICRMIREQSDVPIMLIATPDMEDTCIKALSAGADEYHIVPVSQEKLLAHMQSILNRKDISIRTHPPIRVGKLYIDFSRRQVFLGDKLLDLTAKEYDLLRVLATHQDQVLTHQQLLAQIWGPEYREETQYLWVNISRLRRKMEPHKDSPRYVQTEQGIGYVFREP